VHLAISHTSVDNGLAVQRGFFLAPWRHNQLVARTVWLRAVIPVTDMAGPTFTVAMSRRRVAKLEDPSMAASGQSRRIGDLHE
jgi:hypothetical protein